MNTYRIQVRGQVDVNELNTLSPHLMTAVQMEASMTVFTICTDQSGMIGLLKQLHSLGVTLLSVVRQTESKEI